LSLPEWREEPISRRHDRAAFDCCDAALNEFLQRHARKSHELGGSKTFVAADGAAILGFYSLSPASVEFARAPAVVKRGLARYDVPAFRMARLAVDLRFQGRGLGGQLLLAAGRRCLLAAAEVGGVALLIDAKNDRAAEWYASYGAVRLDDAPLILMLSLATVAQALRKGEL
jgi:GNAT superfamily N-acetyltransferase